MPDDVPTTDDSLDHALATAQAAYLGRVAPGHRTRRVRWSGGTTQILEIGEGPPVLLMHGGLGEAFQWGPLLAGLARRHRVLAVDRPGHGLADPFDFRGVHLLALARRFIGEVLDAESLAAASLVGSSMGGLWSVSFALAHPERVPRLVLAASPAGVTRHIPLQMRLGTLPGLRTLVRRVMLRPTPDSVRAFWGQMLVVHPERLDADFLALSAASQRRNAPSWFTLIDRCFDIRGLRPDLLLAARWPELAVPTTLVWGEKDAWAAPELGDAVAARNPRIKMVRLPDAGHAPWFDAPGPVLAAIETALA